MAHGMFNEPDTLSIATSLVGASLEQDSRMRHDNVMWWHHKFPAERLGHMTGGGQWPCASRWKNQIAASESPKR